MTVFFEPALKAALIQVTSACSFPKPRANRNPFALAICAASAFKLDDAQAHFDALAGAGIDRHQLSEALQVEGVKLFEQAFDQLLTLLA